GDIDAIYQSQQFTVTSALSAYDAKRVEVLTSAIQSIELDEGKVPKLNFVLKQLDTYKAACLGLLVENGLNLKDVVQEMNNKDKKEQGIGFDTLVGNKLIECLVLMERILNQAIEFDIEKGNVPSLFFSQYKPILDNEPLSLDGFRNQEDFLNWIEDIKETTVNLWNDWIWEPVKGMWDTIRHKEKRLALMGKESLNSDLESLERMVLDFARDQKQFTAEEINELSKRIRDGDLSLVLKAYEQELKVQKTKVDLELSMTALDKLLKSNELNFAFLAVGP
ncbi:18469_t:CDS:2, partial [Racocetra fulgida]